MRFVLEMDLLTAEFPCDYRPLCLSYFKNGLTQYLNGEYFGRYYSPAVYKPFTFAVWLGQSLFHGDKITIPFKRIKIYWSTDDFETGMVFYNALLGQKDKSYPLPFANTVTLRKINIEKEVVVMGNEIEVTFASPLCVRHHEQSTNRDRYYSYGHEEFNEKLRQVLGRQLAVQGILSDNLLNDFSLIGVKYKKTVVRHHRQFIEVTLGTFIMRGHIQLLRHLYLSGMASRKSSGYGYFNIIDQRG